MNQGWEVMSQGFEGLSLTETITKDIAMLTENSQADKPTMYPGFTYLCPERVTMLWCLFSLSKNSLQVWNGNYPWDNSSKLITCLSIFHHFELNKPPAFIEISDLNGNRLVFEIADLHTATIEPDTYCPKGSLKIVISTLSL
jgi:hypothetical protein